MDDEPLKIELDLSDFSIGDWEALSRGAPGSALPVLEKIITGLNGASGAEIGAALRALRFTRLVELIRAVDRALAEEMNREVSGKN